MANEISVTPTLSVTPASVGVAVSRTATKTVTITDSAQRYVASIQNIGTSEEAIMLGDVANAATLGYAWFKNLDATNFIQLRTGTGGVYFAKLKPGEVATFRFGSGVTAPYAIADTGACNLEYMIVAD